MSANLYDAEFYAARRPLRGEYAEMARLLNHVFMPSRCFDIGCGPGEIIHELDVIGIKVSGIDGSPSARVAAHQEFGLHIFCDDITTSGMRLGDVDLVLCLETAEHIEASKADALVDFVVSNTSRWLVFSAAYPGQGGTGHVNEQMPDYWVRKFLARGLEMDIQVTNCLRLLLERVAPRQPWYGKTTMVFERAR